MWVGVVNGGEDDEDDNVPQVVQRFNNIKMRNCLIIHYGRAVESSRRVWASVMAFSKHWIPGVSPIPIYMLMAFVGELKCNQCSAVIFHPLAFR